MADHVDIGRDGVRQWTCPVEIAHLEARMGSSSRSAAEMMGEGLVKDVYAGVR